MINQVQSKLNPGYVRNNSSQNKKNISFGMARVVVQGNTKAIKKMAKNKNNLSDLPAAARNLVKAVNEIRKDLARKFVGSTLVIDFKTTSSFSPSTTQPGEMLVTLTRENRGFMGFIRRIFTGESKTVGEPLTISLSALSQRNPEKLGWRLYRHVRSFLKIPE